MDRELFERIMKIFYDNSKKMEELEKTNPELARKQARELLQGLGILDEKGEITPAFKGIIVDIKDKDDDLER